MPRGRDTRAVGGQNLVHPGAHRAARAAPRGANLPDKACPVAVLPGGADYQNLANPPTIDARYLWQTSDGEHYREPTG